MGTGTPEEAVWRGGFGDRYVARNPASEETVRRRVPGLRQILAHLRDDPPSEILECGANVGLNLRALQQATDAKLYAIEPNRSAREIAIADGVIPADRMRDASLAELPFDDDSMDLVFTAGVLIHVPPAQLEQAYREMYRVSRKYLLSIEYFSQKPESVRYQGRDGLLFKSDFGSRWLEHFPTIQPLAQGFLWRQTTGFDDATWWLFRK